MFALILERVNTTTLQRGLRLCMVLVAAELVPMDAESPYPLVKRQRTSSHDSASSRSLTASSAYSSRSPQRDYSRSPSATGPKLTTAVPGPRTLKYIPLTSLARAHARGITCAKFSPDYRLLATGSADATINIYAVPPLTSSAPVEPSAFKLLRTLRAHLAGINALAWSPSGPPTMYTLASASDDKSILFWSPLSSDFPIAPSPLTGHSNYVYSLAFSPKGNMLVSGSFDEAVFLWDVRSGRIMRQLPAHSDPVGGVDFIHDGTMMCSCSTDGLIRIWDAGTGQCLRTLVDEDRKGVTSVRWSPNGRYVLGWTLDSCVRLWDYVGGRCVKTYMGHVNKEFSLGGAIGTYLAPSQSDDDGDTSSSGTGGGRVKQPEQPKQQHFQEYAFVVSGSENGDILAWDVSSKELLWRSHAHTDVVLSVDFGKTADGLRGLLVSVGRDRDVRIWVEDVPDKVKDQVGVVRGVEGRRSRGESRRDMQQHADTSSLAAAMDEDEEQILRMEEG
ncbi:hypothetical protein DV736_g2029, partial [Chaetothyriales sp. CBS 134916]